MSDDEQLRPSVQKEFGALKPRAIILDDNPSTRTMMTRVFRRKGFEAVDCETAEQFFSTWSPGLYDVVVADWDLAENQAEKTTGDQILVSVRRRDWDVPFVLISGKLDQDKARNKVLRELLGSGSARFVERGSATDSGSISRVVEEAQDLIERRDLALLKVVLSFRAAAQTGTAITTSNGKRLVSDILAEVVSSPEQSHNAGRPVVEARAKRFGRVD